MLQLEENGLYQALEGAGDGAFAVDPDGRIVLWNRAAERLLGYASGEALGRSCCDVLGERTAANERQCARDCQVRTATARGHAIESFDMRARTKTGQPLWLNVSTLAVRPDSGDRSVMIHLFRSAAPRSDRPAVATAPSSPALPDPAAALTRREREVLRLLVGGANTRIAAERLGVSLSTVRNHVQNLFGKLGVHSRLEAVACVTTRRLF